MLMIMMKILSWLLESMSNFTKEEFVQILRRQSTRFARGSSNFRGVTLHKCGRWEACMGQLLGKKEYDQAAIKCHGREAITNFNPSLYDGELVIEAINADENNDMSSFPFHLSSNDLPFYKNGRSKNSVPGPPTTIRTQLPHGSMGASVEPPLMSSMNSSFIPIQMREFTTDVTPIYENYSFPACTILTVTRFLLHPERATEKRMDANSFPIWAWQLQGHNDGATPLPRFSAASSSGFPSSTTPSSVAVPPLHFPNTSFLQRHFSPSAKARVM